MSGAPLFLSSRSPLLIAVAWCRVVWCCCRAPPCAAPCSALVHCARLGLHVLAAACEQAAQQQQHGGSAVNGVLPLRTRSAAVAATMRLLMSEPVALMPRSWTPEEQSLHDTHAAAALTAVVAKLVPLSQKHRFAEVRRCLRGMAGAGGWFQGDSFAGCGQQQNESLFCVWVCSAGPM